MVNLIATAAFGLEAVVKRQVQKLNLEITSVADGRVDFRGDLSAIPVANIHLRSADRVLLNVGEFYARTFDELFEGTKALPWEQFIPLDGTFPVTGKSVRSGLFSVPDCQAIVKKAIVERLKSVHDVEWFKETGPEYKVQVGLLKDKVTLTIDTTGAGLHKRGYREHALEAPLKETLASALIELSFWRPFKTLVDPFCGSGTIPIEAALIAKNIAPGISRSFISERWPLIPAQLWKDARKQAFAQIRVDATPRIYGYDIDPEAIEVAKENAAKAGVDDCIEFNVCPVADLKLPDAGGVAICNPPYGERLGRVKEIEQIYKDLARIFGKNLDWGIYVLTADEFFEKSFGRPADTKRKLFNGMIKTDYYQYHSKNKSDKTK